MTITNQNELALIGAFLADDSGRAIGLAVNNGITPEWFMDIESRHAVEAILNLWRSNRPIDILTVGDALAVAGHDRSKMFLDACLDACPTWTHAEYYLDKIHDAFIRQNLQSLIDESGAFIVAQSDIPAVDLAADIQNRFFRLIGDRPDGRGLSELANEMVAQWENPAQKPEAEINWPIESLQNLVGNLSDEYAILAAQPSIGKTAFALQMAIHQAEQGRRVSFASLESRREKIVQRLMACMGGCHTLAMRRNYARPNDFENARAVVERLKTLPLKVTDTGMTIEQLRAWALREKTNGSKLLIIDNMRHIRANKIFKNRFDQFAEISLQLKFIRDDTGLPLIVLHHLSAEDKLAWSADIQRDADLIFIMSHDGENSIMPCRENGWAGKWIVNFEIQKNREGQTGTIRLEFEKQVQFFKEF